MNTETYCKACDQDIEKCIKEYNNIYQEYRTNDRMTYGTYQPGREQWLKIPRDKMRKHIQKHPHAHWILENILDIMPYEGY